MTGQEKNALGLEHRAMLSRALSELLGRLDRTSEGLAVLDDAIAQLESEAPEAAESLALRRLVLLAAAEDWQGLYEQAIGNFQRV